MALVTWRVLGLELGIDEPESVLRERALAAAGIGASDLRGFRIGRKSVDARRVRGVRKLRFVIHADLVVDAGFRSESLARAERAGKVTPAPEPASLESEHVHESLRGKRVAVLGAGPAGLFAALVLARNGVAVDLVERGAELRERGRDLAAFQRSRVPNPESNLLFGEGGAGTYSDGKLYTRVEHELEVPILTELVTCGAPEDVLYDARAHVGTDRLHRILPRLRERLIAGGVCFHWRTRVERLRVTSGRVTALETNHGDLACDALIFAPGHSARDTWRTLAAQGLPLVAKPFQLGVRIEHPQSQVDLTRYGDSPQAKSLGPAYYALTCKAGDGAEGAHSFCMCPGGQIVASVSAPGLLCTNGMSNSRHSSPWANAAVVTTLGPREFGDGPFAGVELQEKLERECFELGGGDYTAPAQRAPDFLAGTLDRELGRSSYRFGLRPARLDSLLPANVRDSLRHALKRFEVTMPGYSSDSGLLVGIEARSSGPVRISRDPMTLRCVGFPNLFPVGEGAGAAGGIMSAAIDGARAAQSLLRDGLG